MTKNNRTKEPLPEFPETYWRDLIDLPSFDALHEDIKADVAIVGGGITGITAAYLLVSEGLKVALLEADRLVNGTTGHTTAKITAQHSLIYDELIQHMGQTKARLYYDANKNALEWMKKTIHDQQINCDFEEENAYIYATSDKTRRKLEKEWDAYQKLHIDGELSEQIPFNINIKNILSMKNQAQFHPVKYLTGLIPEITKEGGQIFEHTVAVDIEENGHPTVITRDGHRVTADYVLACSHFPFYDRLSFYFTRMHANRSYILAAKTKKSFPGGMYISADQPVRSLRSVPFHDSRIALIVGESHQTGQGKDTLEHYQALEDFGEDVLGIEKVIYRWSAQDLVTLDKVPYIGELTSGHPNILVATGYRKWGITSGTLAARLLREKVMDQKSPYEELFSPSRFYADPSLKTFFKENADVAKHLVKGKWNVPQRKEEELAKDEGAAVMYKGHRAGAYREENGELHIVDTTCTHLGCEVKWNHGDRTWDCPCHGSRFSYTGEVVEGPAKKPLKRLK